MARTTAVAVLGTATPLPASPLLTRKRLIVENSSADVIAVGYNATDVGSGLGHQLFANERMEFDGSDILYARAVSPQSGGAGDCTIVTEIE